MSELKKSKERNIIELIKKIRNDSKVNRAPLHARLLFYLMAIEQDDEGRFDGDLRTFIKQILPEDTKTPYELFEKMLNELMELSLIIWEKDKVIQLDKNYHPIVPHTKRKSSLPSLSDVTVFLWGEDKERTERVISDLERYHKNSLLGNGEKKREEQVIDESNLSDVNKVTLGSLNTHFLYLYYKDNLINFKTLVYSSLIYNNIKFNNLQKIIEIYKIIKHPEILDWKKEEHQNWNRLNFKRFAVSSSKLLSMCNDVKDLLQIIILSPKYFEEEMNGVEWTLETIFKRFADLRKYYSSKIKKEWAKSYAKEIQPPVKEKKEEKPLSQEEVNAKMSELRKKLGLEKKEEG